MTKYILIHYGELALKGKNRGYFEDRLKKNIKDGLDIGQVRNLGGRFLVALTEKAGNNWPVIQEKLKKVFGIASFSLCYSIPLDMEVIKKEIVSLLKKEKFSSFAIRTHRANKRFSLSSMEIDREIGAEVLKNIKGVGVSLKKAALFVYLEILDKQALLYLEKIKGAGGLPVNTSGKTLTLISGGIDSPVASWYMMKRGLSQDFIHFHSHPYTNQASQQKVKEIIKVLNQWQQGCKLFLVPLAEIQKEIVAKTPSRFRVILYRRFMVRLAEKIARDNSSSALVTGDSLGQVASQTVANISVIQQAIKMIIFRPLIGLDKQEIIQKAEEISTYTISIEPDQDCCSYLMPRQPATKARLSEVLNAEKELAVEGLVNKALNKVEVIKF